jgi:hypothetical protein
MLAWEGAKQYVRDLLSSDEPGEPSGSLPTQHEIVKAHANAIGQGVPFATNAMLMLVSRRLLY